MTEIQGNREQRPTRASRTAAPVVSRAQGTMASIEDFLELAWVRPELQTMPHAEPAPPDGDRDQRRWLLFAPAENRVDAVDAHERRWPGAAALAQWLGEEDGVWDAAPWAAAITPAAQQCATAVPRVPSPHRGASPQAMSHEPVLRHTPPAAPFRACGYLVRSRVAAASVGSACLLQRHRRQGACRWTGGWGLLVAARSSLPDASL